MSERKPIYWVVKRGNEYAIREVGAAGAWPGNGYTTNRPDAFMFGCERAAGDWIKLHNFREPSAGHIVPVYLKVTKKPARHSWAWACKQLVAGKAVRRACWENKHTRFFFVDSTMFIASAPLPSMGALRAFTYKYDLEAIDWELYVTAAAVADLRAQKAGAR